MAAFVDNGTTSYYSTTASCGNCNCLTGECRRVRQQLPRTWYGGWYSNSPELAVRIPAPALRPTPRCVTSVARAANLIPTRGEPGVPGDAVLAQATPAPAEPPPAWGSALRAWDKR